MNLSFRINRLLEPGPCRLEDVFPDIDACTALTDIFPGPGEIGGVVESTGVVIADMPYEMFVDNHNGSITIGLRHLRNASEAYLYLDILHELCHVRQHRQGRDLYDRTKAYVDRETEIEAYRITVREARRIGLTDEAIGCYLRVSWITPEEHRRLARCLGVAIDDANAGLQDQGEKS